MRTPGSNWKELLVPNRALPPNPDLEQYKKQAKELLKACTDAQPEALARIWNHHPRLRHAPDLEAEHRSLKLSDAHAVIAREHGFESWPKFAVRIRSLELAHSCEPSGLAAQPKRFAEVIPIGEIELAAEISIPANCKKLVLCIHAAGSGPNARVHTVADELHRVGIGTVLADLLTEEETAEDAVAERVRFDLPLLSARIDTVRTWIAQQHILRELGVGYLGTDTGASAALWAASRPPHMPKAVVSLGGRPDHAGPRLGYLQVPTLLITGSNSSALLDMTRFAFSILPRQTTADLEVIAGASNGLQEKDAFSRGAALARSWFEQFLAA
jgi:putative phosphoribosyl transferase